MDASRLKPAQIPPVLYRIDYPGTWSRYADTDTADGGILAADTTATIPEHDPRAFHASIVQHLNRSSGVRSPYISLFADQETACRWALRWTRNHGKACHMINIDGPALSGGWVADVRALRRGLGLEEGGFGEFLVWLRVPGRAIKFVRCSACLKTIVGMD